jgi:hypothetical protein
MVVNWPLIPSPHIDIHDPALDVILRARVDSIGVLGG